MIDYFDWLTAGDSGLAAERLAERFRLSQKEMRQTAEALAPAFALGFQRVMADPAAWGQLSRSFSSLMTGGAAPGTNAADIAGQKFMEAFFGSGGLPSAIARQASTVSGLAPDTIEKLMPSLAMLTMQNMARMMMANAAGHPSGAFGGGEAAAMVAEMMRRGANAVEALGRPSDAPNRSAASGAGKPPGSDYLERMFADALKGGFAWPGLGAAAPRTQAAPEPKAGEAAPNPFALFFDAFAKSMQPPGAAQKEPERAPPQSPPPGAGKESFDTLIGAMMESAQKIQGDYLREMMALFERHQRPDGDGAKKP